ncbi:MAG: hypothetical protein RLZZ234_510 [Candidatus Parcubacteria bacterium]|jgi:hypothetical protein
MDINIVAVVAASVAQFIIGGIWYMPIFGRLWGEIHGHNLLSPEEQKKAEAGMAPYLALQFVVTVVTTVVLAMFLYAFGGMWNPYGMAVFIWLGFVLPTQVSAVLFGGTKKEWMVTKIAIASGGSLMCLLAGVFVLELFG